MKDDDDDEIALFLDDVGSFVMKIIILRRNRFSFGFVLCSLSTPAIKKTERRVICGNYRLSI
jgi:hypothetical protein